MFSRLRHGETTFRQWQINTLRIFNNNVVVIKDNTEYRVEFKVGNNNMSLDVVLSDIFPDDKPTIYINPAIVHPWVLKNTNQVVDAPGLIEFTPNSDLGRVVQAIIREFQKAVVKPELFPELHTLSILELEEILVDKDVQDRMIDSMPEIMKMAAETDEIICSIEKIAQQNVMKQQLLQDLKGGLKEKVTQVESMKMRLDELNKKHQQLTEMYNPHNIRQRLHEAAHMADKEADDIAEKFLDGRMHVNEFVAKFSEIRALGQSRSAKEEALSHQLTQLHIANK